LERAEEAQKGTICAGVKNLSGHLRGMKEDVREQWGRRIDKTGVKKKRRKGRRAKRFQSEVETIHRDKKKQTMNGNCVREQKTS